MSLAAVRAALEAALDAIDPPLPTAWENAKFAPSPGVAHQRVNLLAAEPANPEMGSLVTERGFLQVALCFPLDAGPGDAEARAELLRQTFPRGASFTASGVTTTIETTPSIGPAMFEEDFYVLPVRVRFYAHHQ